jgi:hypothetical protein
VFWIFYKYSSYKCLELQEHNALTIVVLEQCAGGMDTMSKISSLITPPPKTADQADSDVSNGDWILFRSTFKYLKVALYYYFNHLWIFLTCRQISLKTVGKGHFLMTLKMAYSQRITWLSKLKPKTLRAAYFYQMKFHSMIFCPRES